MTELLEVGLMWPPEPFILAKLEALVARGFRVTVGATMTPAGRRFHRPGIVVVELPRNAPQLATAASVAAGILRSPRCALRVLRAVRRAGLGLRQARRMLPVAGLRPDVVHFEWEAAAVSFLPLAAVWGCPIVVSCRGSGVDIYPHLGSRAARTRGYRAAFDGAAAIHCVSEATRRTAIAQGAPARKIRLIRPAVEADRFRPRLGGDDRELRIVSVGELRWTKGHEYALRALARLTAAGVPASLELVGGDPPETVSFESEGPRLRQTAEALGIIDQVTMTDEVSHRELAEKLPAAHVLLHLSLSEGIPNVVLEAMASGLPVVATDVGGTREAVRDGVDGFLVPPRDPAAAAAALERLWREPELRSRLGAAARERAVSEFAFERQCELWADLYAEVLAA